MEVPPAWFLTCAFPILATGHTSLGDTSHKVVHPISATPAAFVHTKTITKLVRSTRLLFDSEECCKNFYYIHTARGLHNWILIGEMSHCCLSKRHQIYSTSIHNHRSQNNVTGHYQMHITHRGWISIRILRLPTGTAPEPITCYQRSVLFNLYDVLAATFYSQRKPQDNAKQTYIMKSLAFSIAQYGTA